MSKGNVDKFLGLMQKDEGLARKMAACLYKLETNNGQTDGSGDFIAREIVPLAKEYGLEFTAQDFLDYTEEAKAKVGLTTEDLAEVSGGKGGVRAALMWTLALLGVAAAPAAMDMLSGGEVSLVSMVASAETPNEEKSEQATPEQLEELQLGIAALKSLNGTIITSRLAEKDMLSRRCNSFLNKGEKSLKSKLKKDVEQSVTDIAGFVDYLRSQSVTNNWSKRRETLATLEKRISLLEGKAFLNQQEIANLRSIANTLKKNLIELKKEQGKGKKATGTNANDFEAKIKSFEDILARAEKLNKNKEQLVQNLQNVQLLVNYNEGKKINEQIADLNNDIKDFSPENIAKKEADFNAINAFTNAIIEVNNLQKEVDDLLKTKGANQNILNDIKGALDIAARDLTKENAADISKVLTEIKEKLKAEKENIKKIKAESKEKKQKEQEEKNKKAAEEHKVAESARFYETAKANAENTLPTLKDKLQVLEKMVGVQQKTDATAVQEAINKLRARIDSFGNVTYENAKEKATELESIKNEIKSLMDVVYGFEENLSTRVTKPKKNIGEMLTFYKNEAKKAKDQASVKGIEKLEQELAAISEQPTSQKELIESAAKLKNITKNIPQIKATLDKATTLKKIAEQVDTNFAKVFDNIIKEIEAADSVDKINLAKETLQNAEITLKGLMRTKINEANKTAHILHEIAKIFELNQIKGNFVDLIDTFDRFNYAGAPIAELYKVYQDVETVNIAENELKNYLGEQIDNLAKQANELKDQANGVDDDLKESFEDTATNLQTEKENLLKDLFYATKTITSARESLAERQGDLMPKLVEALEIDALLENEVMGTEIQDELKAIKVALAEDKADTTAVLKAVDDVKTVKTKMANKLLEWHKILSKYHNKGYHKEGVEEVQSLVETNLETLKGGADKMLAGADEVKLNAENLNAFAKIALKIAENLRTDIADVIDTIENYIGFGEFDFTAGTQANTLVTFLRDKVGDVHALKFVDKKTRTKLAKNIKHIFDQIEIDQETGKYCLSPLYNRYAVNHDDLKLICDAYDVIAEDFGERVSYMPFVEGTTETTNGWSFSSILSSFTGAKEQSQLINKTTHLINELKKVSRLDLLDVSPESRAVLKNDIMEISAKIKSRAHSWFFNKPYYYFSDTSDSQTKNMQNGLASILELYNYLNGQK